MSARLTPVDLMTTDRYVAWAEKRNRQVNRERWINRVALVAIPLFVILVATVMAGYVMGWL